MSNTKLWHPPGPTISSRDISPRSRGSYRCTLVDHGSNREVVTESRLERNLFMILAARRDVASIREQPPQVSFVASCGTQVAHTFDFLVIRTDGLRIAVDVKPARLVVSSGIETVQRLARETLGKAFADVYVVRTEEHIHPDDVADAAFILRARRLSDASADRAVAPFVPPAGGSSSIAEIVHASQKGAAGFNAIVRLIDEGRLQVRDDARISYGAHVTRTSVN